MNELLPNVILIVLDTLRKDYAKPLEDILQKWGFVSYNNVISPASWTGPAHASIFTGLYPIMHKSHITKTVRLRVKLKCSAIISRDLSDMGYTNYLFSANTFIQPSMGYSYFDYFYDIYHGPKSLISYSEQCFLKELKKKGNDTYQVIWYLLHKDPILLMKCTLDKILYPFYVRVYAAVKNWPLDKGVTQFIKYLKNIKFKNNPIFIFVNLMEVHDPYIPDPSLYHKIGYNLWVYGNLDMGLVKKWRAKYSEGVYYISRKIKEILEILEDKNILDNSLVVITSDHGQLLGEYGRMGHGTFLYDELLKVPLLVKYPTDSRIEIIEPQGYISLTHLKQFIVNFVQGRLKNDSILYSETVFAESHGVTSNLDPVKEDERNRFKQVKKQLDKYRIAIYFKAFKGIFNVTDWRFEEIISYNPKIDVTEDVTNHMKKEILRFLKTVDIVTTARTIRDVYRNFRTSQCNPER